MPASLLAALATMIGVAASWPQTFRVLTSPDASGVSALTWLIAMFASVCWIAIGFAEDITATKIYNVLTLLGAAAVLGALVRRGYAAVWRPTVSVLSAVTVNAVLYATLGTIGVNTLGVAVAFAIYAPQTVRAWRTSTDGVSLVTCLCVATSSTLWATFGVLTSEAVIVVSSTGVVGMTGSIAVRVMLDRSRTREGVQSMSVLSP